MKMYQRIGSALVSLGVLFLLMGTGVLILNKPSYVQAADQTKSTAVVSKPHTPKEQGVNDDSLGQTKSMTVGRGRKAYKEILERLKKREAPHVLEYMKSLEREESSDARKEIILRLFQAQDDRATPLLCKVLEEDEDSEVREAAANALGSIGDKRAIPYLARALKSDEDTLVRIAAAISLFLLGEYKLATPFLKEFLSSENDSIRRRVACQWGFYYLTDRNVPEIIPLLEIAIRDENPDIQICAAKDLDEFDEMPRVYLTLREDLKSKDSKVRVKALYGLNAVSLLEYYPRPAGRRRFDVNEIKSAVKKMLKDQDRLVRETAHKVLERMNSRAY